MSDVFLIDSKVRFTKERLSILTPRDRQGLEGRIGVVQTDGNLVQKPTVYFPAEGTRLELRLFRVDPRHLELVESPVDSAHTTRLGDGAKNDHPADAETTAAGGGGNAGGDGGERLSQSDMDNLFD